MQSNKDIKTSKTAEYTFFTLTLENIFSKLVWNGKGLNIDGTYPFKDRRRDSTDERRQPKIKISSPRSKQKKDLKLNFDKEKHHPGKGGTISIFRTYV